MSLKQGQTVKSCIPFAVEKNPECLERDRVGKREIKRDKEEKLIDRKTENIDKRK